MYGVAKGVRICNQERLKELDDRIYARNIPSTTLESQFDPRPVKTRQVIFPVLDCYASSNTNIIRRQNYNQSNQFNPGTSAPYSGWATNIDNESKMKRMFRTTQKWCPQTEYIPSSRSDLYISNKNVKKTPDIVTKSMLGERELLFKREQFNYFNPNPCNLGGDRFNNHTRQQVKNL
tara:strand:- start:3202 stop:3732 length:531 start_codon:yes stop_codon:yes gene_type:complete